MGHFFKARSSIGGLAQEKGQFFKARSSTDGLVKVEGQFSKVKLVKHRDGYQSQRGIFQS